MALSTNAHLETTDNDNQINVVGDTTEAGVDRRGTEARFSREKLEQDLPRVAELPFSSERKAMTTVHEVVGGYSQASIPQHKVRCNYQRRTR